MSKYWRAITSSTFDHVNHLIASTIAVDAGSSVFYALERHTGCVWWLHDLNWQPFTTARPHARMDAILVEYGAMLVMIGGTRAGETTRETALVAEHWEMDPTAAEPRWIDRTEALSITTTIGARGRGFDSDDASHACYDSNNALIFLLGRKDAGRPWIHQGDAWSRDERAISMDTFPNTDAVVGGCVWDQYWQRIVVFMEPNVTLFWTFADGFLPMLSPSLAAELPPRRQASLAYNAQSARVVIGGGISVDSGLVYHDYYELDLDLGIGWTLMHTSPQPLFDRGYLLYDSLHSSLLFFNIDFNPAGVPNADCAVKYLVDGEEGSSSSKWLYREVGRGDEYVTHWHQRRHASITYHTSMSRVLVFGGFSEKGLTSDVSVLSDAGMSCSSAASSRCRVDAAFCVDSVCCVQQSCFQIGVHLGDHECVHVGVCNRTSSNTLHCNQLPAFRSAGYCAPTEPCDDCREYERIFVPVYTTSTTATLMSTADGKITRVQPTISNFISSEGAIVLSIVVIVLLALTSLAVVAALVVRRRRSRRRRVASGKSKNVSLSVSSRHSSLRTSRAITRSSNRSLRSSLAHSRQ